MENTKMWVVSKSASLYYSNIVGVFLNQEEAEFFCYIKSNKRQETNPLLCVYYTTSETTLETVDKSGKEYKNFLKHRLVELEKNIKEKSECKEKDTESIQELLKTKEFYEKNLSSNNK